LSDSAVGARQEQFPILTECHPSGVLQNSRAERLGWENARTVLMEWKAELLTWLSDKSKQSAPLPLIGKLY